MSNRNDEVKNYYNQNANAEWNRLNTPYSKIEFETSKYMMEKYLPKNGHILDIGSGPGRYSIELLKKGYKVTLLDISQNELDIAQDKIHDLGMTAEKYICESATKLEEHFEDDKQLFDGILVMGPMYHLHHSADRKKVLTDVKRLLKPNGVAFIAYINSWGLIKASLIEFPYEFEDIDAFDKYVDGNLKFNEGESFTSTYFTTPILAKKEIQDCGLEIVSYGGAESFLAGMGTQLTELYNDMPKVYSNYLKIAPKYAELPQYRDSTEHLNFIVKRAKVE